MEILLNAYFSSHNPEMMVGSFLGGGYVNNHHNKFTSGIEYGQQISGFIDDFIQNSPICQKSLDLLSPKSRKYGNTILRLFYDHFLAKNWESYSETKYEVFCLQIISVLKSHNEVFPYKPKRVANRIIKKKLIMNLKTINGLDEYMKDMIRYNSYNAVICESIGDLVKNYDSFHRDFKEIFPEIERALSYKTEKLTLSLAS
jgi:acyl carrier protein phosphodiesterase